MCVEMLMETMTTMFDAEIYGTRDVVGLRRKSFLYVVEVWICHDSKVC